TPGAVTGLAQDASGPAVAFLMPSSNAGPTGDLYVYWAEFNPPAPPDGGREGEEKLLATGVYPSSFLAHPLVDGGVAVRINGAWAGVLKSFETTFTPAPSWLTDHPDHDFTIVRGERAYALIKSGRNSIELVSRQGNSCGSVTLPDVGG